MDSLFIYMLQALYLHFVPSFFSTRKVFSLLLGSFVWPAQLKLCLVSLQVAKRFGFFFSVNPWRWRTKFVSTLLACNKLLYATLYCNLLLGNFVNYTKQVLTIKYIYIYIWFNNKLSVQYCSWCRCVIFFATHQLVIFEKRHSLRERFSSNWGANVVVTLFCLVKQIVQYSPVKETNRLLSI